MSAIKPHSKRECSLSSKRRNLARRAIARNDDLFLFVMERVERVKKLFLRPLLAGHKLHVVHQKHVDRAILFAKLCV